MCENYRIAGKRYERKVLLLDVLLTGSGRNAKMFSKRKGNNVVEGRSGKPD